MRAVRTRLRIRGMSSLPRLSVFRSGKHIYAQVIDDAERKTIASASDLNVKKLKDKNSPKERATLVGALIAERAKEKNVTAVVFDRGGYKYHGRIQALANGARKGGLKF